MLTCTAVVSKAMCNEITNGIVCLADVIFDMTIYMLYVLEVTQTE